MESDKPGLTSELLPARLAEVFRLLRMGRHLCRDDVSDFRDLDHNQDQYALLFGQLGYELVRHPQGFFYFQGVNVLSSARLQAITLFVLVLFQDMEEKKFQAEHRKWEKDLLGRVFSVNELPHFETPQRRNMMGAVGVTTESLDQKVLRPMVSLGMMARLPQAKFQFRPPIYRFVDLCMNFGAGDWPPTEGPPAGEAPDGPLAEEEIDGDADATGEDVE